ncbi:hypothetical protein V7128_29665 [Neobacillus vireti]|uniref:hypothetical protein n=1 Tax=Neobacillus vireti TaxID=220686 RepID=UPI002FFD9866
MEIIISTEELLQKTVQFKNWSGTILTRVFNRTGVPGFELGALGSAGLLKYKRRYFVITASHVVKMVEEEKRRTDVIIPFINNGKTEILNLIKHADDKQNDIAAFEIETESAKLLEQKTNKSFLDYRLFDEDPLGYFEKISNVVFLHGISGEETKFDYDNFSVDMTTTPYTTFIDHVDQESGMIVLMAGKTGKNEFGEEGFKLPVFNGMSGSFAYSYRREDKENPFRCLGILTNGEREAGFMWVLPISIVNDFIEEEFF